MKTKKTQEIRTPMVKITDAQGYLKGSLVATVGMVTNEGIITRVLPSGTVFVDRGSMRTGYRQYDGNFVTMTPTMAKKYGFGKDK